MDGNSGNQDCRYIADSYTMKLLNYKVKYKKEQTLL